MAGKDRIPLFLSPRGEAAKAWRLPVLVRGRRKRRLGLLLAIGLIQSLLTVVVALSVKHVFDQLMGQGQDAASGADGSAYDGWCARSTASRRRDAIRQQRTRSYAGPLLKTVIRLSGRRSLAVYNANQIVQRCAFRPFNFVDLSVWTLNFVNRHNAPTLLAAHSKCETRR